MQLIELTQNKWAQVDNEDFEYLNQWKWFAAEDNKIWYAKRNIYGQSTLCRMHREIMCVSDSKILVDHIDRNGLNNQKSNLRLAGKKENAQNSKIRSDNTSGYKGVCWKSDKNKWKSYINVNKKQIHLGYFNDIIEAAMVRDKAAIEYFGEFATLNFPIGQQSGANI